MFEGKTKVEQLKIIQRDHIDIQRWDKLVSNNSDATPMSLSVYLDALAENWCVYVNDEYSMGIALPYTIRAGVRNLYTPLFMRYIEWLGEPLDVDLIEVLKKEFVLADVCTRYAIGNSGKEYVFQSIERRVEPKFNELARRMMRKFATSGLTMNWSGNRKEVLAIVKEELPVKVSSINERTLVFLDRLTMELEKSGMLTVVEVSKDNETVGGVLFVNYNNRIIHLKSAFRDEAKRSGSMYAAVAKMIEVAIAEDKHFDFGGSRVEGVRRFNLNMGGKDEVYFNYSWDNSPFWFKALKQIRNVIRR